MVRNRAENIFNIIILIILAVFISLSFNFGMKSRLFPMLFGSISFIMLLMHMIATNMRNTPKMLRFVTKGGAFESFTEKKREESENDTPAPKSEITDEKMKASEDQKWGEVFLIFACLAVYIASFYFIHYLLSTLIFLILFLKLLGKVKWSTILIFSCSLTGSLYILFEIILGSSH